MLHLAGSDTEDDQDAIESNPFVDFLLTTHEELRQKVRLLHGTS